MAFSIEEIPDSDYLYHRVHCNRVKEQASKDEITSGCFSFRKGELSCDWDKYASPETTRRGPKDEPAKNYVVKFHVGELRAASLTVRHSPIWPENQAHSDVLARDREQETEGRLALFNAAKKHGWVLEPLATA